MNLFAVDASSAACSAAIWQDGRIVAESYANVGLTHSETLMVLCDEVFRRAGQTPDTMDLFAVTSGPGSFTGLRIGMGSVKGMAFAVQKPCVAVPTLEALAWNCCGSDRTVIAVCDARRERVFAAAYDVYNEPREVAPVQILNIDEIGTLCQGNSILFVGDAATLCYNTWKDRMDCVAAGESNQFVRAGSVARAAAARAQRGMICSAEQLVPDYFQISQAERNRKERVERV